MSYSALDAYSSVITVDSSIVSGIIQRPIINIGSVLGSIPVVISGNSSVSGTVGASIIGLTPVAVTNTPSISGTVTVQNLSGSIAALLQSTNASVITVSTPVANQSVSGTVGASVIGTVPVTQSGAWSASLVGVIPGSVVAFQGTPEWTVKSSIAGGIFPISGSVAAVVTNNVTVVSSISGGIFPISGSVAATITNFPTSQNVSGSVVAFQGGTQITSIVGAYAEDSAHTTADIGVFTLAVRNDNVASLVGANLDYTGTATDSAGRALSKPFAAEEARIEGYNSVVSGSVTTLVAAAGAGLRNYITDIWFANTGASATLVTFRSQGGASILGYTIAPAGSGSNLPGLATPIRTGVNETFDIQATTATSVLFATVKGYKAP